MLLMLGCGWFGRFKIVVEVLSELLLFRLWKFRLKFLLYVFSVVRVIIESVSFLV